MTRPRAGHLPGGQGRLRGFTLVEVLLVTAVIGIVAGIAVPNVDHLMTRARASDILDDVAVIRGAAHEYRSDHRAWPPDAPAGSVPTELRSRLPNGFTFRGEGYTLDWESWALPAGLPSHPDVDHLTGVTVVTEERPLSAALRDLAVDRAWFVVGGAVTLLFEPE